MTLSRLRPFALSFLIAGLVLAAPVHAQVKGPTSATDLQALCNSQYDVDAGMCAGYIMAIAEDLLQKSNPMDRICLSPAIGPQVLVDNLRRAWEVSPPQPHELAVIHVTGVLRDRFRCP